MEPKYNRLVSSLKERINDNISKGIYRLPTEEAIGAQHGVSRQTVRRALTILEQEGLIEKRQGSGSYATGLLSNTEKNRIAIITRSSQEYIYPALLQELSRTLNSKGYETIQYTTENKIAKERTILQELSHSSIRGIIVEGCKTSFPNPNTDLYEDLQCQGIKIVFLHGDYTNLPNCISVKDDNFQGGYLLGTHLISKDLTQIGGIFKYDDSQGPERYHGLCSALRDNGLVPKDENFVWFDTNTLDSLEQNKSVSAFHASVINLLKNCHAIVCYNDQVAYWLVNELIYTGIRIQGNVTIVCFDSTYLSDWGAVRMTSLSHEPDEMAHTCADTLLKMLKGQPVSSSRIPWSITK